MNMNFNEMETNKKTGNVMNEVDVYEVTPGYLKESWTNLGPVVTDSVSEYTSLSIETTRADRLVARFWRLKIYER